VGTGSGRRILRHAPPSRSPLVKLNDCVTSSHRTSPWIGCVNPVRTSPWNGSLNGTWISVQLSGTWICGSVNEIWICRIENGTCGCESVICFLLTWSETSFQIWSGNDDVSCCCGNETWSGIWTDSWSSCSCGSYGSCCGSGGDYETWSGCQSRTFVCEAGPPLDESFFR